MKRVLSIILALMLICFSAMAEPSSYSANNGVVSYDLDNDGSMEQIQLTISYVGGMGYIDLNVSKNNVLQSHFQIMSVDTNANPLYSLIRLYALKFFGQNILYIETYATGAESLYSSWMLVSYYNNAIHFQSYMQDPGMTSGVGLYEGSDPVDSSTYLVYYQDYDSFDEQQYLNALNEHFGAYGLSYNMEALPFYGWYSSATANGSPNIELMLATDHTQLKSSLEPYSPEAATDEYVTVTGSSVNVRSLPDTSKTAITVAKKGEVFKYLGVTRFDDRAVAWHYVSTAAGNGWISSKYSQIALIDALIPATITYHVQATASVHIRSGAGLDYAELGSIKSGTQLSFRGEISMDDRGTPWFKVRFNDQDGWVSSKYSKLI